MCFHVKFRNETFLARRQPQAAYAYFIVQFYFLNIFSNFFCVVGFFWYPNAP